MAKTIYTERDIEDFARRGDKQLDISGDVYLTDAAREKAEKLGVVLLTVAFPTLRAASTGTPNASAPVRSARSVPYDKEMIIAQVQADVLAKLGPGADAVLIERIVRRVVVRLS